MRSLRLALSLVCLSASGALAGEPVSRIEPIYAAASGQIGLGFDMVDDPEGVGDVTHLFTLDLSVRGLWGRRLAYGGGLDFRLGGDTGGGVAAGADAYLVGIGAQLGRRACAGIVGGVGVDGVSGRVPFAFGVPVEAFVEVDAGRLRRLRLFGRSRFVLGEPARADGAARAPVGDALAAGLAIRIGRITHNRYVDFGHGLFVGLAYQELMGVRVLGATVGWNLHLAAD